MWTRDVTRSFHFGTRLNAGIINYAERCMRTVAVGRKAFLFVGSGGAGHAAAIYYSLVESCKANQVNPLTYLTHVLTHVLTHARNKSATLPTPDEFTASNITHVG